jgi:hypothetical protein
MNDETHISDDDLVLFALQFLSEEQAQTTREHLANCVTCRAELARLQGDLVAYAMTAEIASPPAEARERLLRQVAKEPKLAPAIAPVAEPKAAPATDSKPLAMPVRGADPVRGDEHARGAEPIFPTRQNRGLPIATRDDEEEETRQRPRRAPWVLAWTGWAVAAGCSFVAGLQLHQRQQVQSSMADVEARLTQSNVSAAHAQDALATLTAANARQVALHLEPVALTKKPGNPAAEPAAYIADKGALVFVATHLEPVASGKTYELWLLPATGAAPIPAGTFKPDAQGSASLVLPRLPKGVPAKGFGVTIENDGGSSTPTLPIVMAGT